ncbi:MAG: flagellar basal-body rod modification protein FlgD [Limisphaerales bacterium]|nr:MAG: flagellar basal-body rod modification protein FlgD [Limisphaerales bacterium]KAG0507094.1 MAG: flagellar basal-body rod modification protein FlgD [Limisphaerales bacterium]TXT49298.1 MAG: flagellar basal-body rod modification protein FlgD [Limisphaerales bacterium]
MSVSAISSATSSAASDTAARVPQKVLDQDDFLKLLMTQFTSQDPMEPMKDTAFIAQMAQFTALEQSKSMTADIAALREQQQILQANGMLGRNVVVQVDGGLVAQGTVTAVQLEAGTPKLVVNGQAYELGQVLNITPAIN